MSQLNVLLVEDNHGDVRMIERTIEQRDVAVELSVAQTGDEALDRLFRRGEFAEAPRPDVVLLDLNLPATDGHAVLETIKSEPRLKRIPVVVLTSTQSDTDIDEAYDGHANACLTKPVDPNEFGDLVESFAAFWGTVATLPTVADDGDAERLPTGRADDGTESG